MKKIQFAGRPFDPAPTTPRISVSHRLFAVLLLPSIAVVTTLR